MAAPAQPTSPSASLAYNSSPTTSAIPILPSLPPPYSPTSNRLSLDASAAPNSPPIAFHPSDPTPSSSRRTSNAPSSSSASSVLPPSTAPTTPLQRTWRPTPNVPSHIARRHRGDAEDRNRWLSEDEGTEGLGRSIGRRRRRANSGGGDRQGGGGGMSGGVNVSPMPPPDLPKTTTPPTRHKTRSATREHQRSTSSGQLASTSHAADLPEIASIVPPPSDVARVLPPIRTKSPGEDRNAFVHSMEEEGLRDGAGLGIDDEASEDREELRKKREKRRRVLEKVRRAFRCTLCPTDSDRLLHHPLTLPCGHTLSSEHLFIPAPPRLRITPDLPAHEVFDLQQHQHQQRLNLWTGVMCPIPTCKRYSPHASTHMPGEAHPMLVHSPTTSPTTSHAEIRSETLPSGVTYYPPPQLPPPAYSADPPLNEAGSPLLDVTVDKVMQMVITQLERDRANAAADPITTDDEQDNTDGEEPSLDEHHAAGLSLVSLSRQTSKRRRNTLRPQPRSGGALTFEKELYALLECDVCSMLLYDPVTTPCQHSFCAKCLSRSLDHSQRCPVCRQELPSFAFYQDHHPNKLLLIILNTAFPEEYAERQASIERDERDSRLDTPIFVCTLAFPGMPTILHVFEPRYRLMIRRCIESQSPRFGMVLPSRGPGASHLAGLAEYGTMLEIQSVQMLPDGRSMVETVGTSRFKLLEKGSLDGYTVGRIERINDITPAEELELEQAAVREAATLREQVPLPAPVPVPAPPTITDPTSVVSSSSRVGGPPAQAAAHIPSVGEQLGISMPSNLPGPSGDAPPAANLIHSIPPEEAAQTTEEYMTICRDFIEQLKSGSAPWLLQRLNSTYGSMPTDPSEFSYWMALVMPIDEYEKARLLPIRSPRLRLKLIVHWVESLRSSWWFSSG